MSTAEIGKKLVQLCQEGKNLECIDTLYAEDVESIEALDPPDPAFQRVTKGLAAVRRKNVVWGEQNEIHNAITEGPYPHGDRFAVRFKYDTTHKASGQRMNLDEIGLFTVKNGKIIREEFFY